MYNRRVLSSLEEDLQRIGLLGKVKNEGKPGDLKDPREIKASKKNDADDDDDDEQTERKEKTRTESLVHRIARARRGKIAAGKSGKRDGSHGSVKAHMKSKRSAAKHALHMGKMDRVANLIEEVGDLVGSIAGIRQHEAAKSFANMALIADQLHQGFKALYKEYQEEFLLDEVMSLNQLAERAAATASALNQGTYAHDDERLARTFKKSMSNLLDGLDLYSDLTEEDDDDDKKKIGDAAGDDEMDDDDEQKEEDEGEEKKDDGEDEDPKAKAPEGDENDGDFDDDDFDTSEKGKKMEAAGDDDDEDDSDEDEDDDDEQKEEDEDEGDDEDDDEDDKDDDEDDGDEGKGKKAPFPGAAPPFGKKEESLLQRWGKRRKLYR